VPDAPIRSGDAAVVDFASAASAGPLVLQDRLTAGNLTLVRCLARPNPMGSRIVSPQTTVVVPIGPAFELDWQPPGSDHVETTTIGRGRVMLYPAEVPVWKRWRGSPSIFVMALSSAFVDDIRSHAFEPNNGSTLRTFVGLEDPIADDLVRVAEREMREGGMRGPLFIESLATSLTVHLLQTYGGDQASGRRPGALEPTQLRRVVDYVEAHLGGDLTLADLAAVVGLSPHHFGDAFKAATGLAPYQYVIDRRVERACRLLRDTNTTVAQVAGAVGFSSQSHLTTQFRRVTGITPARFRRSLA
jgi:AraC family transcriptional regulator